MIDKEINIAGRDGTINMKKKKICIDISNVIPGKGGTGGGISTYAINLIKYLDDALNEKDPIVYCIKNKGFTTLGKVKNIKIKTVEVNNSNFFSRLFWLHVRLPFFCLTNKINVLHRIVAELPALKVCKYIITMHDFMFEFYLQRPHLKKYLSGGDLLKFRFFRRLTNSAIKHSDGIIVPAKTIKHEVEKKFNLPGKKIVALYPASEHLVLENKEKSKTGTFNIGVVAGFYPHKGHFHVLKLAKYFLNIGFRNFKISMRGSRVFKSYVEDIGKEIIKAGLQDFITFESFVSKVSLSEIYSKFDLVLLLSEYEGFGLPVLEAQLHSIPVACSKIPIFEEILQSSAFYLNLDFDQNEVSKFIKKICDKDIMNDMVVKGLNNGTRFSWDSMALDTLALYENFI